MLTLASGHTQGVNHVTAPHSRSRYMLYSLIALLVAFWLVGLVMHIGGGFIHTLLVLALVVFVFDLITGRSTAV